MSTVKLTVNGKAVSAEVEDRTLLVQLLRDHLNLTGTHVGCDTSQCGACVVHVDGEAVKSCTLLAVQAANHFGISVLHNGQETIARAFATKAPVAEKWDGVAWSERDGIPAIDGALAWIACELRDVVAAGDHVIVTGEVRDLATGEGDPLVFHGGEYRPLS